MAAHHLAWGVKKWGAARAFSIDVMGRSSWPTSSMGLHPVVEHLGSRFASALAERLAHARRPTKASNRATSAKKCQVSKCDEAGTCP